MAVHWAEKALDKRLNWRLYSLPVRQGEGRQSNFLSRRADRRRKSKPA